MKDHRRTIPIDRIKVSGRHRVDLGDLGELAQSIRLRGLLHPVVVTSDLRLVAGQRRLEACRSLGWKEVPATVTDRLSDATALLAAERDENTCRKDMTPSEKVALGRALEELEIPKAAERKGHGQTAPGRPLNASGKLPGASEKIGHGDVRDLVGAAVGMSGHTYHRAKTVVEAAEGIVTKHGKIESIPEDAQEVAKEALEEMDVTGKVTGAYNKVAPHVGKKPLTGGRRRSTDVSPIASPSRPVGTKTYRGKSALEGIRTAIGTIAGLSTGFDTYTVAECAPSPKEAEQWEEDLRKIEGLVRRFRRDLKEYRNV